MRAFPKRGMKLYNCKCDNLALSMMLNYRGVCFRKHNGKKVIKNKNWNLSSVWLTVIVHARSFLSILYYTWASLTIYL